MDKAKFIFASETKFYEVEYKGKDYMLQWNYDDNCKWGESFVYDEQGNEIRNDIAEEIKAEFANL